MSLVEDFLSPQEEQEVIEAIRQAEAKTSGEIRVHLEKNTSNLDVFKRATALFHELKMDNTKEGNGVLIYVAVNSKQFAICGDQGINKVVEKDFWERTILLMQQHFKAGHFKQGLVEGILMAGQELQNYFPWHSTDTNELTNEISKG
jgi:uncharacterized membrane protein